ncbi:PLP-dependent aminotransferase family protein [Aureimonas phyllosphaerae]|uniref:DNA-binding transcriptional MocR family regulator n=1 Tax=Aureimonas phyllosphaerae TaxID=1166078 RepID=A0A7W6BTC9_9HYPH|nr:PLP-dependent aminotransferase family protein [Aureimonas phyllosphaerae]MBB3935694.1 DNA-binding transcriptional MocR family regulator [Aureimonas phyllosphaerae]MBB3959702.1 DNA-binding transcriptional MocR family regulator [Aureimonas phyllosphaerae]SFF13965.1 DNA-binding transcriptional regulator, MocR family, contains an aminotransferase domain [Aureimonas phyllosphaerae]
MGRRTDEVMDAVRDRIAARGLAAGDRLPSIRALATSLSVSPSTVVEAYERLAAEGMVRARLGSGMFVARSPAPRPLTTTRGDAERAIDPFWVSRQSLDAEPDAAKPGCGWLPADWMPTEALRRALRRAARAGDAVLTDYGSARGHAPLRQLLARQFAAEGLDVGPDAVLLTGSGTQALDLICRLLLRTGDTVLVDDPCYFNFRALLSAHRVTVVGVPMTPIGPDPASFAELAERHRPRLYVTNSAIHNPTGASLSPAVAHRVLAAAAAYDIAIVEDEILADFEPEPTPRLADLDGLERVLRIGSFSKTLSASVRCGYIAARLDWIEALTDLQIATQFGAASPVSAGVVHDALADGGYRRHMEGVRRRLGRARGEVARRLATIGLRLWTVPRGGFSLWCELPEGGSAADLARFAAGRGVVLAPGDVFSPSGRAGSMMRFNVAQMSDPRVWETVESGLAHGGER